MALHKCKVSREVRLHYKLQRLRQREDTEKNRASHRVLALQEGTSGDVLRKIYAVGHLVLPPLVFFSPSYLDGEFQ